jgi:hypothetical protein
MRRYFNNTDQTRTAATAILMTAIWIGLEPWRPMLAGDDFGYFESVLLTLSRGRVVLSDWLNPFSVGLTVPAAAVTSWVGDIWLGCMLTVGAFGLLGAGALRALLHELGLSRTNATMATLVWVLLPVWLAKWTRFESSVPAASLMILGLWLLLRGSRADGSRLGTDWLWLVGGSVAAAWSISIRQNHVILTAFGAIGLLRAPNLDRRTLRLVLWTGLPLLTFFALQFGLPKTYAMEYMLEWRLSQLSLWGYLANLGRGLAFSAGCAGLLVALTAPGSAWAGLKRLSGGRLWLGSATCLGIFTGAIIAGDPAWIAPATDILLLEKLWPVTAGLTLAGAIIWPVFWTSERDGAFSGRGSSFCLAAFGYLILTSIWGYWEYYYLESSLLLWCAGLVGAPIGETRTAPLPRSTLPTLLVLGLVATSWLGQRLATDEQAARLQIFEQAFRQGVFAPSECSGMHLGLSGWNLFPAYAERWKTSKTGNPLAFWENRTTPVYFRWRDANAGRLAAGDRVVLEGAARIGYRRMPWTIFRRAGPPVSGQLTVPTHRRLPLTRSEWHEYHNNHSRN